MTNNMDSELFPSEMTHTGNAKGGVEVKGKAFLLHQEKQSIK